MVEFWLKLVLYLAPMYFANSSAMFLGGKTALDFGKKLYDDQPILGRGKTIRGTFGGIFVGIIVTFLISYFLPQATAEFTPNYVLLVYF